MIRVFMRNITCLIGCILLLVIQASAQKTISYVLHTVKAGETLSGIAKESKASVGDIMRLNGMNAKSILRIGAHIKIPMGESKTVEGTTPILAVKPAAKVVPPIVSAPETEQPDNNSIHRIKANETLSSIAKANKTTVGDIMRLNGMNSKSILKIGEEIKLPNPETKTPVVNKIVTPVTTIAPPVQTPKKEVSVKVATPVVETASNPIKYTVVKGDNLYRLSKKYNVSEAQIIQWSGMKNDIIKPGQVLVVGQEVASSPMITKDIAPSIKETPIITPPVSLPKDTTATLKFVARDTNKVVAIPSKIDSSVAAIKDSVSIDTIKTVTKDIVKERPTINIDEPITDPPPIKKYAKYVEEEGFYAGYFNRKDISKNTTTGTVGTFKSTSGWNDKKYYILIDDIPQGTIVRITSNHKSICAKVVGPLPNIKEDLKYLARINNAAADALGIQDIGFGVVANH